MELFGHAQRMCKNITVLTGLPCTVAKGNAKAPCGNPASCTQTACLSRRSGRHLYQCPCGRTFLITSLHQPKTQDVCHIIVGPFAIEQTEEPLLPIVTHEELASLDEILQALGGYLSGRRLMSPEESLFQNEALQTMSAHMDTDCEFFYPLEQERRLQQLIRSGSKQEARQLLNEILIELYSAVGTDLSLLKLRIRELITLMSRAATDSGAEVNAVFALCDSSVFELERLQDFEQLDTWLANLLHQFFDQVFEFNDTKHQAVICQLSAYIQGHLSEKLTLDRVAGHVYLSKSYLCRILREELDTTFTEYTNRLRIERSKLYLQRSTMSLTEIACAVGFEDQSYFTRIFKRQVGVPPGKYRSNNVSA